MAENLNLTNFSTENASSKTTEVQNVSATGNKCAAQVLANQTASASRSNLTVSANWAVRDDDTGSGEVRGSRHA